VSVLTAEQLDALSGISAALLSGLESVEEDPELDCDELPADELLPCPNGDVPTS
jgi:hypothetical protein